MFDIRYKGFWIWQRAEIYDGRRWLRLDKESTKLQIEADKLFDETRKLISNYGRA